MAETGLDSLAESLRDDRGMRRLLDALSLGEGFRLHILVCETPLTAQAAVRLLEKETGGSCHESSRSGMFGRRSLSRRSSRRCWSLWFLWQSLGM